MSSHDQLLPAGEVGRGALLHLLYGLGLGRSHRSHAGPADLHRPVQQYLVVGVE